MAPRESARPDRQRRQRQRPGATEPSTRQHRKKRSTTTTRKPDPTSNSEESRDEGRSRGSSSHKTLSSGALAQLNRENERRKQRADRERRRQRRGGYEEVNGAPRVAAPTYSRKHVPSKKRRVVSGAIMEEGRARTSGLRGGGSWGEDEFEREKFYAKKMESPKGSKKKLCEYHMHNAWTSGFAHQRVFFWAGSPIC